MKKYNLLLILFIAFVLVTICSQSSFLYPINPWPDTQTIFTVADGINHGQVMYRDLYEQKGPYIYFIYWLATLVSAESTIGLYGIEILFAFAFLWLCFHIFKLFDLRYPLLYTALLGVTAYSSRTFFMGGSAEELALPALTYILYLALRKIHKNILPNRREYMLSGALLGLVFYIKYTTLGFGSAVVLLFFGDMLRKKEYRELGKAALHALLGFLAVSAVPLIYLGANGALYDFYMVYFYNNIFLYGKERSLGILDKFRMLLHITKDNMPLFAALAAGLAVSFIRHKKLRLFLLLSFVITLFFTYIGSKHYPYYDFIFCVFLPFFFLSLDVLLRKIHFHHLVQAGILVLLIPLAWKLSPNTYLSQVVKEDLPQYQFAKIMRETPNANLLNTGFLDSGFYRAAGILPDRKYFCLFNVNMNEIYADHIQAIDEGAYDYVVTRQYELEHDKYELAAKSGMYVTNLNYFDFYLYKRK